MTVSSRGRVHVASQLFTILAIDSIAQGIEVMSFTPGETPAPPIIVDAVVQDGTDIAAAFYGIGGLLLGQYALQGEFKSQRGFDLAVDKSGGPFDGSVYLVWEDGRDKTIPEFLSALDGTYEFADVFMSTSADGGKTFSSSTQVNSDVQPATGRGFDHYQPTVAVDQTGKVGICWYDRRNDPQNFQFERFCSASVDGGASFAEFAVPGSRSTSRGGQDLLVQRSDAGQYNGLATDFLGKDTGFVDAFEWLSSGTNPDVRAHTFR
jgi:hypothetical protein